MGIKAMPGVEKELADIIQDTYDLETSSPTIEDMLKQLLSNQRSLFWVILKLLDSNRG